jgi:hypothetical protein
MTFGMAKKPQIDKFREAARELEADEDEQTFDKSLERVAKRKPGEPPKEKAKGER